MNVSPINFQTKAVLNNVQSRNVNFNGLKIKLPSPSEILKENKKDIIIDMYKQYLNERFRLMCLGLW